MSGSDFSIDFQLDEAAARLTVKVRGTIDSVVYTEKCLVYYAAIPDPARYDRLVDLTEANGYVNFEDLKKLSDLWNRLLAGAPSVVRVAVVTNQPLINARMEMVDLLSRREDHRAFATLKEAIAWLDEAR